MLNNPCRHGRLNAGDIPLQLVYLRLRTHSRGIPAAILEGIMYNFIFLVIGVIALFMVYFLIRHPLGFALVLAKWICYVLTAIAILLTVQLVRSEGLLWVITGVISVGLLFLSVKLRTWAAG